MSFVSFFFSSVYVKWTLPEMAFCYCCCSMYNNSLIHELTNERKKMCGKKEEIRRENIDRKGRRGRESEEEKSNAFKRERMGRRARKGGEKEREKEEKKRNFFYYTTSFICTYVVYYFDSKWHNQV